MSGRMPRYSRHCRARASPLTAHLQRGGCAFEWCLHDASTPSVLHTEEHCRCGGMSSSSPLMAVPHAGDDKDQIGHLSITSWVTSHLLVSPGSDFGTMTASTGTGGRYLHHHQVST